MQRPFVRAIATAVILLALDVTAASAHHSFNAYDMSKTQKVSGTIKEFRWGAPHSSMVLVYEDNGKISQMSVVSASPLLYAKQGFAPRDFHKGDKVKLTYHPNVNGLPGGTLASLTTADGRTFWDSEAARALSNGASK